LPPLDKSSTIPPSIYNRGAASRLRAITFYQKHRKWYRLLLVLVLVKKRIATP